MKPKTKHIAVKYHFFNNYIEEENGIVIQKIDTLEQIIDIFTKCFSMDKCQKLRNLLCGWYQFSKTTAKTLYQIQDIVSGSQTMTKTSKSKTNGTCLCHLVINRQKRIKFLNYPTYTQQGIHDSVLSCGWQFLMVIVILGSSMGLVSTGLILVIAQFDRFALKVCK